MDYPSYVLSNLRGDFSFFYFILAIGMIFVGIVISVTVQLLILKLAMRVSFVRSLVRNIINDAERY